jgi:hypothetical protein
MKNNKPLGIKIIALLDFAFGIFILGCLFKAPNNLAGIYYIFLSRCPCALIPKIAVLVAALVIILLIKSGVQIFKLKPKGREDHINFSSIGILILLFFLFLNQSLTNIICGLLITHLAWSIYYLNTSRIKKLFEV